MLRFILALIVAIIGVSSDDLRIRFLTPNDTDNPNGLFFDDRYKPNVLTYVESDTYMVYTKDISSDEIEKNEFTEFKKLEDGLTFAYPQIKSRTSKNSKGKVVVGTKKTISSAEYSDANRPVVSIVATVDVVTDDDYEICKAHADYGYQLLLVANSKTNKDKGGQLYKFVDKKISLVKEYTSDIMDFAWKLDYTLMYLIKDNGKTIVKYDYNLETQEISNEKIVFTLPTDGFGEKDQMTGIETDRKTNLWVVVNNGKLLKIQSGELVDSFDMPVKYLTGITFGGQSKTALLISTEKDPQNYEDGAGGILIVTGTKNKGVPDNPVEW